MLFVLNRKFLKIFCVKNTKICAYKDLEKRVKTCLKGTIPLPPPCPFSPIMIHEKLSVINQAAG